MRRLLLRIAVIGLAGVCVVLAGGALIARAVLGADDATARERIEGEVRSAFEAMTGELRTAAARLQLTEDVRRATAGDEAASEAVSRLFEAAAGVLDEHPGLDLSVTIYRTDGFPLAWAGRPTGLGPDGARGGDAWFLAPGELGLRLMHVTGIEDDGSRLGLIAVERPLAMMTGPQLAVAGPLPCGTPDAFCFPTRIGPVAVHLPGTDGATERPGTFRMAAPSGEQLFTASIRDEDLAATRGRWRRATMSTALMVGAATLLLLIGPLLDWRNRSRTVRGYAVASLIAAAMLIGGRLLLSAASPADWNDARLFSGTTYASGLLPWLLRSPFDFWLTWLTAAVLVALGFFAVEQWRVRRRRHRRSVQSAERLVPFFVAQLTAGVLLAVVLRAHERLLEDTVTQTTLDLLHFSLQPWDSSRTALQLGLIALHVAVVGAGVLIIRAALVPWRLPRHDARLLIATIACWMMPLALVWAVRGGLTPPLALVAVVVGAALMATQLKARYRHGSQAFRLMLLTLALIVPAVASYPTLFHLASRSKTQLVETYYADEALTQRNTMTEQLLQTRGEIDEMSDLPERITQLAALQRANRTAGRDGEVTTDLAFRVWRDTVLQLYPITSSIELYGPDGRLVSRFAYNLPEDRPLNEPRRSEEAECVWGEVYGEVTRFFAEERPVLHAGREICGPRGELLGSIVVHAMLDYENLPFISSRTPYRELLRPAGPGRAEDQLGRDSDTTSYNRRGHDVEFAFYGWSGRPLYPTNETAWHIDNDVLTRLVATSNGAGTGVSPPFWQQLGRGDQQFNVYLQSDRSGIYALGFPVVTPLDHMVNIAELTALAAGAYCLLLLTNALFGWIGRRTASAPALLREVRASFYRKLFLAFVAAVILPVGALAFVTRNYVANELRANVEQEALRTAAAARRFVEDRVTELNVDVDDNLMVWVSRLIEQDANIFEGPELIATSERDLFESDLLPTRVPADVYRALQLNNQTSTVTHERVGGLDEHLVAATQLTGRQSGVNMMLTVPLTSRQQDIEGQITILSRRLLLGALIFVLGGAFLGYWMAERISDPVNRLTRATRRISRGDLDARIIARSSDELRRLVDDFNSMASELQRQRTELERTHRLEAWAEMARQVAHDIKNPLTPIQLTAEHLRRVHADRGEPLSPILQECVQTILTQVRLLRQIASEFSSFASSPIARPSVVSATELIRDIVEPYRAGLQERIDFDVRVPEALPALYVDRGLASRALSNLVENALHAMPGRGTLTVWAEDDGTAVRISVADTGAGMDAEALSRAFEPYFSTKATGTGLGLTIAKRNVELNGGTIAVRSEKDRGTTVELRLPTAQPT